MLNYAGEAGDGSTTAFRRVRVQDDKSSYVIAGRGS